MHLDLARQDTFTIAVLPDTQQYAAKDPATFHLMTGWIAVNRDAQRIAFCSHVGDVVKDFDRPSQWAVGDAAMARLDGIVPYGISVGNNDMDEPTGDASMFCRTFPPERYRGCAWYGGEFRDNANSWQTIEPMGLPLLFVHLECNAPDPVLDWANQVIAAHPSHRVVATVHMFLAPIEKPRDKNEFFTAPRGVARWAKCHGPAGNSPQQMWDKCLSLHPNLFLLLCGDQSRIQTMRAELRGRHGNRVDVCLCDYYGAPEGWLRLHRFALASRQMEVITFGAVSGTICTGTPLMPRADAHRFVLELEQ
jgi:hypothetical protein